MVTLTKENDFGTSTGVTCPLQRLAVDAPGTAGESHHSTRRSESSQPVYSPERIRRLVGIFVGAEVQVANETRCITRALKRAATRWAGRQFKTDPSKEVDFSFETLRRLYAQWVQGGRKAEALALHYVAPPKKATPELGLLVAEHCLGSEVQTMAAAIRRLNESGAVADLKPARETCRRSVQAEDRAVLRGLLKQRRALASADRKARKALAR